VRGTRPARLAASTLSADAAPTLYQLRQELVAPVLVYGAFSDPDQSRLALAAGAAAHLPASGPIEAAGPQILLAMAVWREQCWATREAESAQQRYEERTVIEIAKGILMQEPPGRSEAAAYRSLQLRSMKSREPMADLAADIIRKHQEEAAKRQQADPAGC
jgi:AmiR/NasT family two-component response regulator